MVEFKSHIIRIPNQVWYAAILVPGEIGSQVINKDNRRVVCTINNQLTFQCALMPGGEGNFFINTNKEIRKKLKLEIGDSVEVLLKPDNSEYGMPVCEELLSAWEIDEHGYILFKKLTLGKQRSLIHIVGKPKSSEIRIKKALVMLEYLKSVDGKLDFKELNEAFKQANKK
ncbi:MAG: DUF1905 domain-containing protein [Bacteroidia bacterium]|nr:DUF1905 domain-containing protein [Bacteroidia bacterium]NNJ56474.1 DUF1905 domain-containing protein [Bacteroidia bacterium]